MPVAHPISFARALVTNIAVLVLALGLALVAVMTWQGSASSSAAAKQEVHEALDRAEERLRILVKAAEMTVDSAERVTREIEVSGANAKRILEMSLAAFEQRPELSYLAVAVPETGEYGSLGRTSTNTIWLRLYRGEQKTNRVGLDYLLGDGGFNKVKETHYENYDPRVRPFYLAATGSRNGKAWIPAYPWLAEWTGPEALWGFTYSRAVRDPAGKLLCVWDADIDLPSLNKFLRAVAAERNCNLQLLELGKIPRLVGHGSLSNTPAAPPAQLAPLLASKSGAFVGRMELDGREQWVAARRMTINEGFEWLLVASLEHTRVEQPLRRQLFQVIAMGLAMSALVFLVSIRMAKRLGQPLEELENHVSVIERNGPESVRIDAQAGGEFRETRLLSDAFGRMAASIRQRERELARQNSRLRSHLDNTPLAVLEWDGRMRIVNANAAAASLFGVKASEMLGRTVSSLVAPEDRIRAEAAFSADNPSVFRQRLFAKGKTPDDRNPGCEWYITRLASADEGEAGGCALVLDVSQRLEAEQAFRAADERFRELFERSPAAVCLTRARDGVVLDLNAVALKVLGIAKDRDAGQTLADLGVVMSDRSPLPLLAERLLRDGTAPERIELLTRAGRKLHCLIAVSAIEVDREDCHLWVAVDLTEQMAAEEQKAASLALKGAIFDSTSTAIFSVDHRMTVVEWNAASERLFGLDRAKVLGRTLPETVRGPDGPMNWGSIQKAVEPAAVRFLGAAGPFDADLRLLLTTRDGREIRTYILNDITARRTAERQADEVRAELERRVAERTASLESANGRLKELDRLKSQFLATMSHELRTPLNSILGFTDLLLRERAGPINEEQRRQLRYANDSGRLLLALINDLLDVSRIEAGRLVLKAEPLDLSEILAEVATTLGPAVSRKNLAFEIDQPASGRVTVMGDRQRVFQVLLNVANNAVKFTEAGGVYIGFRGEPDGGAAITVRDTGIGMNSAQLPMLFEAFRQLDSSAQRIYEGTGLGLHLVKRLLGLMGGSITVESMPGKGSTFTIRLPASPPAR